MKHVTHVSDAKKKALADLSKLVKEKKTILIVSIKDIPASQIQEVSKKFRSKAVIRIPKKNLILKAFESSSNEKLKELKDQIKGDIAILFSDEDSFELAAELIEGKKAAKAKIGQEAPADIEVPAGPTELVPGPAISELGALGIKIQIEGGKISIKEPKVIVKQGQKITSGAADVMNKLGIKPFEISLIPLAAFDAKEGKLYLNIKIDRENTLKQLKSEYARILGFAVGIGHISPETIKFLIGKAGRQEKAMENLVQKNSQINTQGGNQ